jgi:hypothetical protein
MEEVKVFHLDAKLQFHYFMDENGMFQGEYKSYDKDDNLFCHCFYLDSEEDGIEVEIKFKINVCQNG